MQSLHGSVGSSTPVKLANGNHPSAAAASVVADALSGATTFGLTISPPSSGGAGEGFVGPAKRDDSRDIVSSPGASGVWVLCVKMHVDDGGDDDEV